MLTNQLLQKRTNNVITMELIVSPPSHSQDSTPKRIFLRVRWDKVPAEETHKCAKITRDFYNTVLHRRLEHLGMTDWLHLSGDIRGHRYIGLDLNCDGAIPDMDRLSITSYIVKYDNHDDPAFQPATLTHVRDSGKLWSWGDRSASRSASHAYSWWVDPTDLQASPTTIVYKDLNQQWMSRGRSKGLTVSAVPQRLQSPLSLIS